MAKKVKRIKDERKERRRESELMAFDFLGLVTELFGPALAPVSWIPSTLSINVPF